MLIPVILSGGAGTRLWPISREMHPKPFMRLADGQSLIQKTIQRALTVPRVTSVLTITSRKLYFHTRDEYQELPEIRAVSLEYLLEPCGRNTAPAVAVAAQHLLDVYGVDSVMLVMPADHLVHDHVKFAEAAVEAAALAEHGKLVTFGVPPHRPETGYGYIQMGDAVAEVSGASQARAVRSFVEKPDLETAESYLASGDYLWNSGIFCFKPSVYLEELEQYAPDIYESASKSWKATKKDVSPIEVDAATFARVPDLSIDYAVMERSRRVAVVPGAFDWSDIGSWQAFSELTEANEHGNRVIGEALLLDTSNTYVNTSGRMVATVGLDNTVIVDTPDALLVAARDHVQDVKEVARQLKEAGHASYKLHTTVHRPWGTYTVLEEAPAFKMKRIVVKPDATLSLQYHHHRSEHWVVVSGMARVRNGDKEYFVRPNESTYIPAGNPHRLSNPGVQNLVIIEIQCGEYLGEDDIVRIEDRYGRVEEAALRAVPQ